MIKENKSLDHLINNLDRICQKDSIFNYKSERKSLLSIGKGDVHEWLNTLLPNTRIILEPNIIGLDIAIQYIDGKLNKAIDENNADITEIINYLSNIPLRLPIKNKLEIRGIVYDSKNMFNKNNEEDFSRIQKHKPILNKLRFCATQIFHCNLNHSQSLKELNNLSFEIPETHSTNYVSDIQIYYKCWKEGKLFKSYPTNGIVLKINSKKLQKNLGENDLLINWAYTMN